MYNYDWMEGLVQSTPCWSVVCILKVLIVGVSSFFSLPATEQCWLVLPSLISPCSLKSSYPLVTMVAPTKARPSVISLDGTSSRLLTISMSTTSLHDLNLSWYLVSLLPRCILRKCSNNFLHILIVCKQRSKCPNFMARKCYNLLGNEMDRYFIFYLWMNYWVIICAISFSFNVYAL